MREDDEIRKLVERAQGGDREAFLALSRRHRESLDHVIEDRLGKTLQSQMEADDVFQETLLRAWQAMAKFKWQGENSFARWLNGIALNVILEAASQLKRNPPAALEIDVAAAGTNPSKALQREERLKHLKNSLDLLPADYKKVLLMVHLEGLTVAEIARRMNRTPNAVSHLILRALRKLREAFGDTESLGLPDTPLDLDPPENQEERHG